MRWEGTTIYVRCRECQTLLAGPLVVSPTIPERGIEIGDAVDFRDPASRPRSWRPPDFLDLGTGERAEPLFSPREGDLWVSASWTGEGQSDQRSDAGDGLAIEMARKRLALHGGSFGCCGYSGEVACPTGHSIGYLMGECTDDFVIWLDGRCIERSDLVDGLWEIYELEGYDLVDYLGLVRDGVPVGHWVRTDPPTPKLSGRSGRFLG
jgi:hypothetical protein